MNYGPLIFLGALLTFSVSWYGMIVGSVLQLGKVEPAKDEITGALYPGRRPGLAERGREVYRANGCNYCHTQQTQGFGVVEGTNFVGYAGSDIERGWGARPSVARDFVFDRPVMLGSQRIGQDLANVGVRQTNEVWHLMHLYNPRSVSPGSVMPPYEYLFEKRKFGGVQSLDALPRDEKAVGEGYEIVPKEEARTLVAYLLSLRAETVLMEAPLPVKKSEQDENQPATNIVTNASAGAQQ